MDPNDASSMLIYYNARNGWKAGSTPARHRVYGQFELGIWWTWIGAGMEMVDLRQDRPTWIEGLGDG
jgi:hypothetical protein